MRVAREIYRTMAASVIVMLAIALLPSAGSVSRQGTLQTLGDPCTSMDLAFGYGVLTLCTSKSSYRFSEAVDTTLSLVASQDVAFSSATVEVIYRRDTVFASEQLCLIPEGCLVKAGETLSTMFFWTAGPPAGSYTITGTVVWDFACTLEQPPCLPIIVPPPAVATSTVTVRGARA